MAWRSWSLRQNIRPHARVLGDDRNPATYGLRGADDLSREGNNANVLEHEASIGCSGLESSICKLSLMNELLPLPIQKHVPILGASRDIEAPAAEERFSATNVRAKQVLDDLVAVV